MRSSPAPGSRNTGRPESTVRSSHRHSLHHTVTCQTPGQASPQRRQGPNIAAHPMRSCMCRNLDGYSTGITASTEGTRHARQGRDEEVRQGIPLESAVTNGQVIAAGEHCETGRAAMAGIESVRKNAAEATFVDGDQQPAK